MYQETKSPFDAPLLLTEREAAESLAISPRKLFTMRTNGEISHVKLGKSIRYDFEDLKSCIDLNKYLPEPSLN